MKRHLTETEKLTLLDKFKQYLDGVTDGKVNFTEEIKSTEKLKIYYTPEAFSKTVRLIMSHSTEIAWHCLVRKKDKNYEVYDVLSYPQTVGPAHVHVKMGRTYGDGKPKDPTKYYTDWYNEVVLSMPEEEERNLCGQCHSHVNMGTTPSSVDLTQQKEELELKGRQGYYLFQIWNKKLEVNSFLYDLDAGILYEQKDIDVVVEEDDFTSMSHKMLTEPEPEVKKIPEKKTEYPKGNVTKFKSYDDDYYDDWCDYYPYNRYYYSQKESKNYNKYIVCVAEKENVANNFEYVVEAHNSSEAAQLFSSWALFNEEYINADLDLKETDGEVQFIVATPTLAADSEVVDISYEEMADCYYADTEGVKA